MRESYNLEENKQNPKETPPQRESAVEGNDVWPAKWTLESDADQETQRGRRDQEISSRNR